MKKAVRTAIRPRWLLLALTVVAACVPVALVTSSSASAA